MIARPHGDRRRWRRRNNSRLGFGHGADRPGPARLPCRRTVTHGKALAHGGWAEPSAPVSASTIGASSSRRRRSLIYKRRRRLSLPADGAGERVGHGLARPCSPTLLILRPDRLGGPALSRSLLVAMATASSLSSYTKSVSVVPQPNNNGQNLPPPYAGYPRRPAAQIPGEEGVRRRSWINDVTMDANDV